MTDTSAHCPSDGTLARLLDGAVSEAEADAVWSHVDLCTDCRVLLGELGRARGTQPEPEAPVDDERRLLFRGERVAERYLILDPLGMGGMGVVYAAYDPQLDRKVALKRVRSSPRRLLDEAQLQARLAHENVVQVLDAGVSNGQVYLALELVEGTTLRGWLRAAPRAPHEIAGVLRQAALGLAAAHGAGLVHGDFKPDNVLVGRDGRARVADFGLARSRDDRATAGGGTPGYVAPELVRGAPPDVASDQYAFARSLAEALEGREAPAWLRAVVRRASAAVPGDRYPSMRAVAEALAHDPQRTQRRRAWATAAALVVAAGAVGGLLHVRRESAACEAAVGQVEAVWGASARERVVRALEATGVPYAAASARTVRGRLDRWAARWAEARRAACGAGASGDEAARAGCLDEQRAAVEGWIEVLEQGGASALARAAVTPLVLDPRGCDGVVWAGLGSATPERARVEAAVLLGVGAGPRAAGDAARGGAVGTGGVVGTGPPPPLAAEQAPTDALDQALRQALEARDDRRASALAPAWAEAGAVGTSSAGAWRIAVAEALVQRGGGDLDRARLWALEARRQPSAAAREAAARRAIAAYQRLLGPDDPALVEPLRALARACPEEAPALRARAARLAEEALGPGHPQATDE